MDAQQLRLRGGTIAYRTAGSGPAVILIHGMASSSETWNPIIHGLAGAHTVYALDLPGHGASSNPGGDYSLGSFASSVRDFMMALDIAPATIVGHSFGGGVAMQAAYQFPERCGRLVLVDSGGLGPDVGLGLRALALPGSELVLSIGCAPAVLSAGRTIASWLHRAGLRATAGTEQLARCYASLERPEARTALLRTLRSVVDARGQRVSALGRLGLASEIPTMIVWGERDRIIPVSHAHSTHEAIPGSTLQIFPTGHFPHAEEPEEFVRALADFIASTESASLSNERARELLSE